MNSCSWRTPGASGDASSTISPTIRTTSLYTAAAGPGPHRSPVRQGRGHPERRRGPLLQLGGHRAQRPLGRHARRGFISNRLYDAMACGAFVDLRPHPGRGGRVRRRRRRHTSADDLGPSSSATWPTHERRREHAARPVRRSSPATRSSARRRSSAATSCCSGRVRTLSLSSSSTSEANGNCGSSE